MKFKFKRKYFMIISVVIILVLTSALFFNARMRSRKIIGFTKGHNVMCVGRITANVSTCPVDTVCSGSNDNWEIVGGDEVIGFLFGRASKKDTSGNDVAWSTMYNAAKVTVKTCYNNMKSMVRSTDQGSTGDLKNNNPDLYGEPNKCNDHYNHGTTTGWRRWIAKNFTGFGNFHADIVTKYCNDETQFVAYRTSMSTKAKKPKESELENKLRWAAGKAKSIVNDVANNELETYVCGTAAAAGAVVGPAGSIAAGLVCGFLWEKLDLDELIGNVVAFLMELTEDLVDFMYETKLEGRSACNSSSSSDTYIVQCSSPVSGAGSVEYKTCNTDIEKFKVNRINSIMNSQSVSSDYQKYDRIQLVRDDGSTCDQHEDLNQRRDWSNAGRGVVCEGSRTPFPYIACGAVRTMKNEINAHQKYLMNRCIETGHIDCTVRLGQSCMDVIENKRFKSGPNKGIIQTTYDKRRMYRHLSPEVQELFEDEVKEIMTVKTCTPYITYGREDCNFSICGRPRKTKSFHEKLKRINLNKTRFANLEDIEIKETSSGESPAFDIFLESPFNPDNMNLDK
jgi:hypothetical protein